MWTCKEWVGRHTVLARYVPIFHKRVLAATTIAEAPQSAWLAEFEVFWGRGSIAHGLRHAQLGWANPQSYGVGGGVGRQRVV